MQAYLPDHYRLLGVSVRAGADEIKASYRKLSRVFHPDRQRGSERATDCFKQISQAYAELSDEQKRARYDRAMLLKDPLRMVDDPRAARALDVLDLVVTRFRRKSPELLGLEQGRDLRVQHDLDFTRALMGGEIRVEAAYDTACSACAGEGTCEPERNPVCHVCQGLGRLRVGLRRQEMTCGFCQGRGAVLLAPCQSCRGEGKVPYRQQVLVAVPPRTRDGTHLRVRGAGEKATLGGPAGDLVVVTTVRRHPLLRLEGDDLTCTLPLTFAQATGGARVAVPTMEGPETLRILPGTPVGREFRIAGRGAPVAGARPEPGKPVRRGDLRIRVTLDVPEHAPAAVVEALREQEARMGPTGFAQATAFARAVEATRPSTPDPDRAQGSPTPS